MALLFALFATAPSMTQAAVETAMRYLPAVSNFGSSGISFDSSLQDLQGGTARVCSKFADMWNAYAHGPGLWGYKYGAWVWNGTGIPTSYGSGGTPGPAMAGYVYSGSGRGVQCSGTWYHATSFYCESGCTGTRYAGESFACGSINPGVWCINVLPPTYNDSRSAGALYAYCPVGYQARLHNTDPSLDRCEAPAATCPVTPLGNPPFSDACSTSLEEGKGVDINNKCDELTDDMKKAAACIKKKIEALSSPSITYNGPSATIRTAEYQNHLRETWDKSSQLNTIMNSVVYTAETKQACVQRKAEVDAHKALHKLRERPSSAGDAAPHVERRAVDISLAIIDSMATQVNVYTTRPVLVNGRYISQEVLTSGIEEYINSRSINPSPECDISPHIYWGGNFTPDDDPVHFQVQ